MGKNQFDSLIGLSTMAHWLNGNLYSYENFKDFISDLMETKINKIHFSESRFKMLKDVYNFLVFNIRLTLPTTKSRGILG